jgi:hypothetical protein
MLSEWFSITRTIGLIAYTVSFAACLLCWIRSTETRAKASILPLLAGVQLTLLLDMIFDLRWRVHEFWMRQAMADGLYGERRGPQFLTLAGLAILLAIFAIFLFMRFRSSKGLRLAIFGTTLSVGLCFGEAVSYHNADRVLHASIGGAMVVSFLWCGLSAFTCIGLWMYMRDLKATFRH